MAFVKKIETKRTKNSKPQPSFQVRWQEPERDDMGRPIPLFPTRPDGQKKQVHLKETYGSKEEAQERCDELNAQRHRTTAQSASEIRKAGDLPYGHYAAAWLESMEVKVARGQLKDRTLDDYRKLLHRYVLGRFGGQSIATITARQAEEFLASLVRQQSRQGAAVGSATRLSPATIKHAWSTFGRVLKYAMRHDAIPSNPADRVDFAGKRSTGDHEHFEHHPLTATKVAQLSGEVASMYPIYGLMVDFLAYSGLRASENSGLEIRDLSFTTGPAKANGSPTTRCAISVRRTKNRKEGRWESSTPKSKRSRRTVPLPTWLAERMRDYLAEEHPRSSEPTAPLWPSRKNGGGFRPAGERYAVPLDWTQPIAMGAFYDTIFRPALVVVGLPASAPATTDLSATRGVRLHDLRHTFATMHLMAGTHFMQVSKWLGHSTFTLTLDTYGDWIPEEDGGAGNTLPEPPVDVLPPVSFPSNVVLLFGNR